MKALRLFALAVVSSCLLAQTQTPDVVTPDVQAASIQKDAASVALIQKSLANMRPSTAVFPYADSIATGVVKAQGYEWPITIKTKGTTFLRIEVQTNKGLNVRIVNNDRGVMRRTGRPDRTLSAGTIAVERISHIPAFSLLNDFAAPNLQVLPPRAKAGATTVGLRVSSLSGWPRQRELPYCEFDIDPTTNVVTKMRSLAWDEDGNDDTIVAETTFSDYRAVNGIAVPFRQSLAEDGRPISELLLTSVRFNVGIADSDFDLEAK
jgi:hypothetical protein